MNLTQALNEAQTLADRNGYRVAIVDFNGSLDIMKNQYANDNGIKVLEIVRPKYMKPPYSFQNLAFNSYLKK